ncbi:hypothetical protein [Paenibacillus sp. 481]|uniref:hypothetical protein n=1 Tax=Paenibacillus sp. 481 TaxID=2835869 RepID=UPI001E605F13|nr:hypothetical protein [Paenibacillus sp. 481]UHA74448.1 hypothetical protein KIK04_04895 [Paenibacillus sp. 481]
MARKRTQNYQKKRSVIHLAISAHTLKGVEEIYDLINATPSSVSGEELKEQLKSMFKKDESGFFGIVTYSKGEIEVDFLGGENEPRYTEMVASPHDGLWSVYKICPDVEFGASHFGINALHHFQNSTLDDEWDDSSITLELANALTKRGHTYTVGAKMNEEGMFCIFAWDETESSSVSFEISEDGTLWSDGTIYTDSKLFYLDED